MNIAFLSSSLIVGGAERLTQSLLTRFDKNRFSPTAITLYDPGPVGEQVMRDGVPVVSNLARSRFDFRTGGRLGAAIETRRIEAVYTSDSALPLFWMGQVRRSRKAPAMVVGFHSMGKRSDFIQLAASYRSGFPVTDRFVALSNTHRDFLCRQFRLDPSRFCIIPVGIDLARFSPPDSRSEAKTALNLPPDDPVVGIVAALRPEKNHSMFIHAAARLHSEHPSANFLIVGDGPERPRLEALTKNSGAKGYVRFLGSRSDTAACYQAMDVAVLCSHPVIETFPQVLIEAQASAVPCVSADVGSIRDVLDDGVTGFLTPAGDELALTEKIGRLLLDSELRAKMGEAARARAERLFAVEKMVAAYQDLFLDVVRTKR